MINKIPYRWKELQLKEVLDYDQPNEYIVESEILEEETQIPVLTANKSFIKGYTNDTKGIYNSVPVIIFDDFTADNKFVNFPFKVKSSAMKILKLKDNNADLKFIFYQMQLIDVNTTTHKRYYISLYQNLPFIFPTDEKGEIDLEKQRQIVDEIEKQFTRLDASVKDLKSVKDKLEIYRKSVLKKVFEKNKTTTKKISELCGVVRGGSPRPAGDPKYYGGSIPFLKVADLTKDEGKFLNSFEHTIKEAGLKKTRKILPNTLLLTNSGATLGVPKISKIEATMNDGIAAFLNLDPRSIEYMYYFLLSKTEELRSINQGAAQPNLNTNIIKNIAIPYCDFKEQKQIVQEIESHFSVIDKLKEVIDSSLNKTEQLRKSILKSAFEGKLVKSVC